MPKNEGLTETIFQRRVSVYVPSLDLKAKWDEAAAKRGSSVSEMVFQIVQQQLTGEPKKKQEKADDAAVRKENADLKGEIAGLRNRIKDLEVLVERKEKDLETYRAEQALRESPGKQMDRQLILVLSNAKGLNGLPRAVGDDELRKSLKIGASDEQRLKALNRQLHWLESMNMVKRNTRGWLWNA